MICPKAQVGVCCTKINARVAIEGFSDNTERGFVFIYASLFAVLMLGTPPNRIESRSTQDYLFRFGAFRNLMHRATLSKSDPRSVTFELDGSGEWCCRVLSK